MDKRKYVALSLEEELRSSRPRYNNHSSNTSTNPSKPKSNNNNPAPKPINNNTSDQKVKDDPFKQVQEDELEDGDDDDDDDDGVKRPANVKRAGRRKIKIEYIQEKSRRHITFSKRKSGIMKKAFELSTLTGTQVLLLVVSETGLVYTFTTPKLQPIVTKEAGRNLIQACLHSADPSAAEGAEAGASGAGAEGDNRSDDDNDELQQQEDQEENEEDEEVEVDDPQQEAEGNAQGTGSVNGRSLDYAQPTSSPLATMQNRPSTSGPYNHPRYPPPPPPHPHPQSQGHTGTMMYPPSYSHIPYPITTSTTAGGPPQAGGATEGGGSRPYWEHPPYQGYGYGHYPPPPPPHHHPHHHQYPPYPHPHHYPQPLHGKTGGGGGGGKMSSSPDSEALRKEE